MSTKLIGRVFGLEPNSIFLFGDDDSIEIPNDIGHFSDLRAYTDYEVQGNSCQASQFTGESSQHELPLPKRTTMKTITAKRWSPFSRGKSINKPPGVTSEIAWQKSIEIHSYTTSGLEKHTNYPLELTPSTANITSISAMLSAEVFNGQSCVLLDVDNLKIPDSTTTRGK